MCDVLIAICIIIAIITLCCGARKHYNNKTKRANAARLLYKIWVENQNLLILGQKPDGFCQLMWNVGLSEKEERKAIKAIELLKNDFPRSDNQIESAFFFTPKDWNKRIKYLKQVINGSTKKYNYKERFVLKDLIEYKSSKGNKNLQAK